MGYDTVRRQTFLRGDEIISLKYEDIAKELAVISYDGTIECLPMKTLGKEEEDAPNTLEIWHDKNLPHIDLIRCLFILMHIDGIKTGCMFDNVQHLENTFKDDVIAHDSDHISHVMFLYDSKNTARLITHRECKILIHRLRNTACMLAIFSNSNCEDTNKSSRHKTDLSCTRHEQDMTPLLEMTHRKNGNHNMLNLVPKWLNMFMRNNNSGSLVHMMASSNSSIVFFALHHHATCFVKQQLKA